MTTYRTKDGAEYPRYEKFTIKWIATLFWIPLLVGENRVRYFESSQLTEIVDPRLTGMVYGCEEPPQNFDSGLDYCYPQPLLTVILTPELARNINHVAGMRILSLENNISLYHESMAA